MDNGWDERHIAAVHKDESLYFSLKDQLYCKLIVCPQTPITSQNPQTNVGSVVHYHYHQNLTHINQSINTKHEALYSLAGRLRRWRCRLYPYIAECTQIFQPNDGIIGPQSRQWINLIGRRWRVEPFLLEERSCKTNAHL